MRYCLALMFLLTPVAAEAVHDTTFDHPKDFFSGLPIDYCLFPARQCGQPSAQHYCQSMKAGDARTFQWEHANSGTFVQGSGETCDLKKFNQCNALTHVVCGFDTM